MGIVDAASLGGGEMSEVPFDDRGSLDARNDAQLPAKTPELSDTSVERKYSYEHTCGREGILGIW